ncbi:glycosyltransferase family 2 protein [Anaerolineales bacterium HSG25]|nr:glycosyltransferase family 2 protein [Anaerolineales bacterium HSG25]
MNSLTILLLNWNRADTTLACLARLTRWQQLQPQIWLVDNASHDDSVSRIKAQFSQIRLLVSEQNLGFAGGNNLALRQLVPTNPNTGQHDYILLLNNDAEITELSVSHLSKLLDSDPAIGVVGPIFKDGDRVTSAGGGDVARQINTHLTPKILPQTPYSVGYVSGTAALFRANLLREVGLFDEAYFFSGEMADWCERVKQKGYQTIISPTAEAFHDTDQAGEARQTLYAYYIIRNRFLFIRKFRAEQKIRLYGFWLAYGSALVLKSMLTGRWLTGRAVLLALMDGLSGEFGGQNQRVMDDVKVDGHK